MKPHSGSADLRLRQSPIPEDPNESLSNGPDLTPTIRSQYDPAPSPTAESSNPPLAFTPMEASVDAVCINCQDYISYPDIDSHSIMCLSVICDPATPEEDLDVRIRKLHRGVTKRMKSAGKDELMTLIRLRELAIAGVQGEKESLARVEMEAEEIATNTLAMEGGVPCSIYARRLLMLVSDKIALQCTSTEPDEAPSSRQRELLRWQSQAQALNLLVHKLDDVSSDISSEARSSHSSRSSSCYDSESDIGDLEAAEEALKQLSDEQLKKYFYSVCLKQKLILPKHHPKQKFLVSQLYEEALRQSVPISKWEKFIIDNLLG